MAGKNTPTPREAAPPLSPLHRAPHAPPIVSRGIKAAHMAFEDAIGLGFADGVTAERADYKSLRRDLAGLQTSTSRLGCCNTHWGQRPRCYDRTVGPQAPVDHALAFCVALDEPQAPSMPLGLLCLAACAMLHLLKIRGYRASAPNACAPAREPPAARNE